MNENAIKNGNTVEDESELGFEKETSFMLRYVR